MRICIEGKDLAALNDKIARAGGGVSIPYFGITCVGIEIDTRDPPMSDWPHYWWDCDYEIEKTNDTLAVHLMWGDIILRSGYPMKSDFIECFFEDEWIKVSGPYKKSFMDSINYYLSSEIKDIPMAIYHDVEGYENHY
jgi:hypothetical protein